MTVIEKYTRELHAYIENFVTWMSVQLYEVYASNLLILCEEMGTFRLEK